MMEYRVEGRWAEGGCWCGIDGYRGVCQLLAGGGGMLVDKAFWVLGFEVWVWVCIVDRFVLKADIIYEKPGTGVV